MIIIKYLDAQVTTESSSFIVCSVIYNETEKVRFSR